MYTVWLHWVGVLTSISFRTNSETKNWVQVDHLGGDPWKHRWRCRESETEKGEKSMNCVVCDPLMILLQVRKGQLVSVLLEMLWNCLKCASEGPLEEEGGEVLSTDSPPLLVCKPYPTPVQWLPTCLGYSNFYGTSTSSYTREKRDSSSWGKELSKWGNKCYSIFSWMQVSHGLQGPLAMKGMCCGEG